MFLGSLMTADLARAATDSVSAYHMNCQGVSEKEKSDVFH